MPNPTITPAHRRHSLLCTLYACDIQTARVGELVRELELVHNIAASSDLVRADLMWLTEMGLCRFKEDTASMTERGRDVVFKRAAFPG